MSQTGRARYDGRLHLFQVHLTLNLNVALDVLRMHEVRTGRLNRLILKSRLNCNVLLLIQTSFHKRFRIRLRPHLLRRIYIYRLVTAAAIATALSAVCAALGLGSCGVGVRGRLAEVGPGLFFLGIGGRWRQELGVDETVGVDGQELLVGGVAVGHGPGVGGVLGLAGGADVFDLRVGLWLARSNSLDLVSFQDESLLVDGDVDAGVGAEAFSDLLGADGGG